MDNKKPYWVLISFMVPSIEPRAGYVCVNAESAEDAEKQIREGIGTDVQDLIIESISEEIPEEVRSQMEINKPQTVN